MKILVRGPNWIGDQLMTYPFFHHLRKRHPDARITVACVPWVADLQFRNLVDDVRVIHPPSPHQRSLLARFQVVDGAARDFRRKGPWDIGYSLPSSLGAAWFLWRSGCRRRVGYVGDSRGWLLTESYEPDRGGVLHRSQAYLELLFPKGQSLVSSAPDVHSFWTVPAENELDPPISGEVGAFPVEAAWPNAQPLVPPDEPFWVLAPGSMAESRRWGEDRFERLARLIVQETGWQGLIVGGPKEAPIAERLRQDRSLRLRDWTARGPVTDLWRLCRSAKFVVANDSGIAHFASLCGAPTFIPWGAGDPRRTRPLGPGAVQIEANPVDCWPCERNVCERQGAGLLACLRGLHEEVLWKQIHSMLLRDSSGWSRDVEA